MVYILRSVWTMWSIVQYKNIGRDVEREWRQRSSTQPTYGEENSKILRGSHQSGTNLQNSDPERNAPNEKTNGESDESKSHDGKITVEINGDGDPIDPHKWPLLKRARVMVSLFMLVFTQAWAGATDSLHNKKASMQYHVRPVVENLSTAI